MKIGDAVEKDQPLLTLSEPGRGRGDVRLSVGAAPRGRREAALGKAQADFDRAADLFEHNAVAKKDVHAAENALAQAKAALEQAQARARAVARGD